MNATTKREAKVFYAQRLPKETIADLKEASARWGTNDADVIARLVAFMKRRVAAFEGASLIETLNGAELPTLEAILDQAAIMAPKPEKRYDGARIEPNAQDLASAEPASPGPGYDGNGSFGYDPKSGEPLVCAATGRRKLPYHRPAKTTEASAPKPEARGAPLLKGDGKIL